MIMVAHQPNFIPYLPFIHKVARADVFVVLDQVQYPKNNFVNRVKIRTSKGEEWLTVPVRRDKTDKRILAVKLPENHRWRTKMFKTLAQNYGRSPFWSHYLDIIRELVYQETDELVEYNMNWLTWILKELDINTKIVIQSQLGQVVARKSVLLAQLTKEVGCDTYLSGLGGTGYLKEELFTEQGIKLEYTNFIHPVYEQAYKPFIYGMSVLDALLNEGPNLRFIL